MGLRLEVLLAALSLVAGTPSQESPPCSVFMNDASVQFLGITADMLGRFAAAARVGRRSHVSRVATVVAQDLVGSLLGLAEASFVYTCHVTGCRGCDLEHASSPAEANLPETNLQRRRELLSQKLRGFDALVEGCSVAEAALVAEDHRRSVRKPEGMLDSVTNLRGAVVEALQKLSTLTDLRSPSTFAAYIYLAANSSELSQDGRKAPVWPWTVRLAQTVVRPRLPFMRSSVLCDADGEALYKETSLPASLGNAPPFKDSSGTHTWLSVPARSLLEALHHAGHHSTYTYWSILPSRKTLAANPSIPCNEAHGSLYDPTVCLEDAGWGGLHFLLTHSDTPHKRSWKVTSSPRSQQRTGHDDRPAYINEVALSTWPPEPPQEPVDLLFLHPMAENCRLLPELLGSKDALFRLLYVPVNPTLPPPMRAAPDFSRHLAENVRKGSKAEQDSASQSLPGSILAQCSLAEAAALVQAYGYELLHMEHLFAVFVLQAAAAPLRRDLPTGEKPAEEEEQHNPQHARASMFEVWRLGWFCSPVSRYLHSLDRTAGVQPHWFGLHDEANATLATCAFLAHHNLHDLRCGGVEAPATVEDALTLHPHEGLALRHRLQWALEMREPLPGVSFHLQPPYGFCTAWACECMVPYRGRRCDEIDRGQQERSYAATVQYLVNAEPVHLAELLYALRNLWQRFNSHHDYPVQVFHDGLPDEVRVQIVLASPNRVWFHHVGADFLPAETPEDLREKSEEDGFERVSHHSFDVGYRAQSRFRSGPVFAHPASRDLDYILSLDTDSMFPADLPEDPIKVMHDDERVVLLFVHAPVTSPASCRNFWGSTMAYSGHRDVDLTSILRGSDGKFMRHFLVAQLGWDGGPLWSHRVTMTDWEVLRVGFYRPGTEYYNYFEYLDQLGGFWMHRWGDHAVRGMGTALALELMDAEGARGLQAKKLNTPYAHQQACFCGNQECVKYGPEASGEPLWPPKKPIWVCRPNATSQTLIMDN